LLQSCFIAGTLALAASHTPDAAVQARFSEMAREVTRACVATYQNQPSGIGPEASRARPGQPLEPLDTRYMLRPETVESVFYMWRLTKDPKYREWNWAIAQAIEKQCRCGRAAWALPASPARARPRAGAAVLF
jgi:mannosyl-oligosaccharide alpha-1,2-mannosidase